MIFLSIAISLGLLYWVRTPKILTVQSPDEAVLAYFKAVMADNDMASAIGLLCQNGYAFHKINTEREIKFWSGQAVKKKGYDFRIVRVIELPKIPEHANPTWKVWVSFRYEYEYEGRNQDLKNDGSGGGTYVEKQPSGYCVAPWAGG